MNHSDKPHREPVGDRVRIRKRGKKGTYTAEFWHEGQHCRRSLGTNNKRVARLRAIDLEYKLHNRGLSRIPAVIAIRDAIDRYLGYLEAEGRARKTLVRYRGELEALATYMEGACRMMRLKDVTIAAFDRFRAERKQNHGPRSMYHEGVVAKQFMKWCVSRELLEANPIGAYKLVKPPKNKKPAPTLAQLHAILSHCHPRTRDRILVLTLTGMRVGELAALRKSDVDLKAGFISIVRQLTGPTKTGQSRRVPIHAVLRYVLERQLKADNFELLFTAEASTRYPTGGRPITPKHLNDSFKLAVRRAGLAGYTLHSLRHFFIRHAINRGTPERAVRSWVGQVGQRDTSTGDYYDLTEEESQAFMNKLSFDKPGEDNAAAMAAADTENGHDE